MSHCNETSALLSREPFGERVHQGSNIQDQVDNHHAANTQKGNISEVTSNPEPEAAGREAIVGESSEIDQITRKRVMWALPALAIGVFLSAADQTIVVSSYGKIGSEMDSLNNTSWIATGYLLTLTAFQLLYGRLSDIFGRKSVLLFAFAVFGLGCLFCGLARTMTELIAARAFAGVGGGGFNTLSSVMLSDAVPLRDRGTWQGYRNVVFTLGLGLGVLGGVIVDSLGWRWTFFIQLPFVVIGFVNALIVLRPTTNDDESDWKHKFKKVDFGGALTLLAAILTLLVGLDQGSNVSWHSPSTIACLCVSFVLFTTFRLVEWKVAAYPFLPGRILAHRSLSACLVSNFLAYGGWLGIIYYLPLYWQAGEDLNATQSAIRLLPGTVAGAVGSLVAGWLMKRSGRYYWLTTVSYFVYATGLIPIILSTGWVWESIWGIWVGTVLCGFFSNMGATTTLIATISHAGRKDQAVAIASIHLFRSLGAAVGIATSSAVAQQALRHDLDLTLDGHTDHIDWVVRRVSRSLESIKTLNFVLQKLVRSSYAVAMRWTFIYNLCLVAGAVLASILIQEKTLDAVKEGPSTASSPHPNREDQTQP